MPEDILKVENIPATKIAVESRIATKVQHIQNALALSTIEEQYKTYIQEELKAISALVSKGLFEV